MQYVVSIAYSFIYRVKILRKLIGSQSHVIRLFNCRLCPLRCKSSGESTVKHWNALIECSCYGTLTTKLFLIVYYFLIFRISLLSAHPFGVTNELEEVYCMWECACMHVCAGVGVVIESFIPLHFTHCFYMPTFSNI